MNFLRLFTVLSLFLGVAVQAKNDSPAEIWFTSPVDHFNFADNRTFQQRCLVNASAWTPDTSAPIFFYTGNEGPIEEFYDNTGFVFDHAPEFEALVVFCEHRYYGHSLPFGTVNETFTRKNIGYLSIEQALADYAVLIPQIREMYNANKKSMVISFGGSYGGMLTAWFRLKYPDVVDGALAGSAPLAFAVGAKGNPPFFDAVTADVDGADQRCPKLIREAFSLVLSLANAGEKGLQSISERMRLCKPLTADRVTHLILWARNAFTTLGMMDYPYPTNFLCPLPAFPIVSSCQAVLKEKDGDLLSGLADAASLVYNATNGGEAQTCFDIETEFIECADQTGCGVDYNSWAWDYQVCTEIVLLVSTNNVTDMFPPYAWNMETLTNYCTKRWGVTPNPNWTSTHFGGSPADPASAFRKSASRIIFSNGLLDPWHGGGFLEDVGREEADMPAVILKHGAHHLDLRSKNPKDPETTTIARATEVGYIRKWLKEGPQ